MNSDAVLKLLAFGDKIFSNESNSESDEETLGFKFQRIQRKKKRAQSDAKAADAVALNVTPPRRSFNQDLIIEKHQQAVSLKGPPPTFVKYYRSLTVDSDSSDDEPLESSLYFVV